MSLPRTTVGRLRERLERLYPDRAEATLRRIEQIVERRADQLPDSAAGFSQRDVALITYADQIRDSGEPPLATLRRFLVEHRLDRLISTVHLLPFFPYSSDDGFSVIDYRQVDPNAGDWDDVDRLGQQFDLMFDLVLNHVSRSSRWFLSYLQGDSAAGRYFIEVDPDSDLSAVTRPRSTPVVTAFDTSRGRRRVWTTFSDDQIDLNFAEPDVLVEIVDVLLLYIERGARIIRLDAVAYLWKQIGTSCIHLPQTHTVVKLLRDLVEAVAPGVRLLTETNVPHEENVSYFGDGDEAHMVYQFSLAPLLLDAMLNEDARPLTRWLAQLQPAPDGATYFNFTASHDGVGVRPLEGLIPDERFARLIDAVRDRGGRVSTKRNADGADAPYELNITYFDALGEPGGMPPELHVRRFLSSQAIMLALRGIPGVYFHSLVGTPNDDGLQATGRARSINRRKYDRAELEQTLSETGSTQASVFRGYQRLLAARTAEPAFHPDATQQAPPNERPEIFAFRRESAEPRSAVVVASNVSSRRQLYAPPQAWRVASRDLITGQPPQIDDGRLVLEPYQTVWLNEDR